MKTAITGVPTISKKLSQKTFLPPISPHYKNLKLTRRGTLRSILSPVATGDYGVDIHTATVLHNPHSDLTSHMYPHGDRADDQQIHTGIFKITILPRILHSETNCKDYS